MAINKMKVSLIMSLCVLLCLINIQQCHGGEGDVLLKFLETRQMKKLSANEVDEVAAAKERHVNSALGSIIPQRGSKEDDKISELPGQPRGVNFDQYSGYVTVDADAGKALFYYFTESTQDPSNKPLVLWLNGGPGCSSFGNGGMAELGPFRVNNDGKTLWLNEFAWNNVANVLFLESPAGVGFSYSNRSDYIIGDKQTSEDSYTFLINWMERFPEYKNKKFYIAGESYAGHYVPQLAQLILSHKKTDPNHVLNLQGIATGNAFIDIETQNRGSYDFYWSHALVSDEVHEGIVLNCNFSAPSLSDSCYEYKKQADFSRGDIYYYDIYAPLCGTPQNTSLPISGYDPCTSDYVDSYLNTAEVQEALHVRGITQQWVSCNSSIHASWQDSPDTVLPIFQELMQSGIRVWIYSGDTDYIVSVTTSRYAIDKIKTSIKKSWYPWYFEDEVGGYAVAYQNLTFVTVRGSGHFVPGYQPGRALTLFSSFISGTLPPEYHI